MMDGDAGEPALALARRLRLRRCDRPRSTASLIAFGRVSPFILTLGIVDRRLRPHPDAIPAARPRGIVSPGFREFFNGRIGGVLPVLALALLAARRHRPLHPVAHASSAASSILIGANPARRALSGLPVARVTVAAYALSGLFAALGGPRAAGPHRRFGHLSRPGLEFDVLAAVVLGGTTFAGGRGGVGGTLAGVLVLFIALNLANVAGLPFAMQLVIKGAIIIARLRRAFRAIGAEAPVDAQ